MSVWREPASVPGAPPAKISAPSSSSSAAIYRNGYCAWAKLLTVLRLRLWTVSVAPAAIVTVYGSSVVAASIVTSTAPEFGTTPPDHRLLVFQSPLAFVVQLTNVT